MASLVEMAHVMDDQISKGLPSALRKMPYSPNARSEYGRSLQWRKKIGQLYKDNPVEAQFYGRRVKQANVHNMYAGR